MYILEKKKKKKQPYDNSFSHFWKDLELIFQSMKSNSLKNIVLHDFAQATSLVWNLCPSP